MPAAFSFDQARCTGCQACVLACTIENGLEFDRSWRAVYTFNDRHLPDLPVQHLSLGCNHCDDPACMRACPANAYTKDAKTGFVVFDEAKCIGCRYCTWACPYGAPRYDAGEGVVGKCTFCDGRQADGLLPACVALCPTGALGLAEVHEPSLDEGIRGLPKTDLGPAMVFVRKPEKRSVPVCSEAPPRWPALPNRQPDKLGAKLKDEWPLAAFTYIAPILVAWVATSVVTAAKPAPLTFLGVAGVAAVLSLAHLGKKALAWRAILNPGSSWLSREILCFTGFCAVGWWHLAIVPRSNTLGVFALATGFATLISIDQVYGTLHLVDRRDRHSASSVLTGLFLIGVFSANPLVAGAIGTGKLLLYVHRKVGFRKAGKPVRHGLSALRIACGFLIPGLLWALLGRDALFYVIATVFFGELFDRLEFYAELDPLSPARQMTIDLLRANSVQSSINSP